MSNQLESSAYVPETRYAHAVNAEVSPALSEGYGEPGKLKARLAVTPESATPGLMAIAAQDVLAYGMSQADLDKSGINITSMRDGKDANSRWANELSSLTHLFSYMSADNAPSVLRKANQELADTGVQFAVNERREVHLRTADGSTDLGYYGRIKGDDPLVLPDGKRFIEPFSPQRQLPEHTTIYATDMASDALASAFSEANDPASESKLRETIERMGGLISRMNPPGASIVLAEANRVLEGSNVRFAFNTSGYAVLLKDGEPMYTLGKAGEPYVPRHWGRRE